jgi:Protein of unknown function (DUF2510)
LIATVRPARPTAVKAAVCLIAWALIVNISAMLASLSRPDAYALIWPLRGASAVGFVVTIGLVTAIAFGRRWALIVFTVLFVLGSLLSLPALLTTQHTTSSLAWFAADTAIRAVAIVLLFGRPATAWFAAYRPRRPQPVGRPQTPRPHYQAVPAAWHPDPTGRHTHRYWDGTAWTPHVADDGRLALDPLEARPATGSTAAR